jgi:hypothetical protein
MLLHVRQLQVRCGDGLVEVAHEVCFGHGRQLVKGCLLQPGMMTPVELRTRIGRAAQFLQCAVP